jgi:hypothetical protein
MTISSGTLTTADLDALVDCARELSAEISLEQLFSRSCIAPPRASDR